MKIVVLTLKTVKTSTLNCNTFFRHTMRYQVSHSYEIDFCLVLRVFTAYTVFHDLWTLLKEVIS